MAVKNGGCKVLQGGLWGFAIGASLAVVMRIYGGIVADGGMMMEPDEK